MAKIKESELGYALAGVCIIALIFGIIGGELKTILIGIGGIIIGVIHASLYRKRK